MIQWGVFRHLRREVGANAAILLVAIALDVVVLGAFAIFKWQVDAAIVVIALIAMVMVFAWERLYLRQVSRARPDDHGPP